MKRLLHIQQPFRGLSADEGFTLIEILVAMAITALIGVAAIQTLNQATQSRDSIERNSKRFNNLERAFYTIHQDILQIASRTRRNEFGDSEPSLKSSDNAQFPFWEMTRIGRRNPAQLPRSSVERLRYQLEDHTLYRYSFPYADGVSLDRALKRDLIEGVEAMKMSFYDGEQWTQNWPPLDMMSSDAPSLNPLAIKLTLELEDRGVIERLFVIPDPEATEEKKDDREQAQRGGRR